MKKAIYKFADTYVKKGSGNLRWHHSSQTPCLWLNECKTRSLRQYHSNVQVEESMAVEKLHYCKGRRHLRGMKFVQLRRGNVCICVLHDLYLTIYSYVPVTGFIVNLIGLIVHLETSSLGSLMHLGKKTEQCFFFLCANVGQIVSTMTDIQLTFCHAKHS